MTVLDRYSLSGDWRGGELVAALVVNVPGFPIPDALAASGELVATPRARSRSDAHGDQYALVAAGIVHPTGDPAAADESRVDLAAEIRALRNEIAVERRAREAAAAAAEEEATRERVAGLLSRVHRPRLERIGAFAASAGKPAPAPKKAAPKPPGKAPAPSKGKAAGAEEQPQDPAEVPPPAPEPEENTGEAAAEATKQTSTTKPPKGKDKQAESPDPQELGDAYKQQKQQQEAANAPGLLDDPDGEEPEPVASLLDDGDTGTPPEDFELMLDLLDDIDEDDIALIEALTGLPVHERLEAVQQATDDPDGDTPPNITEAVAQRQIENEGNDPVKKARTALEEAAAVVEGGAVEGGKKRPASARPTVTAAKAPNWVAKHGGLPAKVRRTANHLKKKGFSESHAIAVAINVAKKACRSGDTNWPGKQRMNGKSKAEYCADLAQWEAMKAATKGH